MRNRSAWYATGEPTVLVWDRFVRLFHWSLVSVVAIAFLTSDNARWFHERVGYAVLALIGARLVWGVAGTHHALFVSFIAGPRAMMRYLRLLCDGRAPRYLGHNPAGGAMIVALLMLLVVVSGSGWLSETDAFFGVPWVDHLHHYSAHLLLALVGLHVAGVVVASWLHRENLVLAMITGRKPPNLGERAKFEHERCTAAIAPNRPH